MQVDRHAAAAALPAPKDEPKYVREPKRFVQGWVRKKARSAERADKKNLMDRLCICEGLGAKKLTHS